jgi:peptide/nickel transport system substrate-binding protein
MRRARGWRAAGLLALWLAACGTPTPSPPGLTPTPLRPTATPGATETPAPRPTEETATPGPTPTPPRVAELTLCLAEEPTTLYQFAQPEAGRAHILAALYDGPIDAVNYGFAPVLFEHLPSLENGEAEVRSVRVGLGTPVVNSAGLVVALAEGTEVTLLGGNLYTHTGEVSIELPQMVVRFRLREGLTWSDGAPLTAHDSVFAFDLGLSPDSHDPRADLAARTAGYSAPDDQTLLWAGLPGYVDPTYDTNFWTPLPRHRFEGTTAFEIADSDEARTRPLGWGPYMVETWQHGDRLVLARNPNYWRAGEGLPRIERLVYRFFASPEGLAEGLRSGECDVAPSGAGLNAVLRSDPALSGSGLAVEQVEGALLEFLSVGIVPDEGYARPAGADLFQDARVRQGLAYCLGRGARLQPQPWVSESEPGVPAAYVPVGHPLFEEETAHYFFNPEFGRGRLIVAGWPAGDAEGEPPVLTLAGGPTGNAGRLWLMEEVARQLRNNCGVVVETRELTRGEVDGDWPDGVVFGRRFDLALLGWRVGATPLCNLFTTNEIPTSERPGGANAAGYSDPGFDEACRRALATLDPAQSAAYHAEAQRLFAEDLPAIPLFAWPRYGAARPQVTGYQLDANSASEMWNVEEWYRLAE